jgi:hypothetical protein
MIARFKVENFKSIVSCELELGTVNVFIGANGSGKSNLLEAIGLLAAAAFGRVDEESIVRRGVRFDGVFRPQFKGANSQTLTRVEALDGPFNYSASLESPPPRKKQSWRFKREVWGGPEISLSRYENDVGDPQVGRAALKGAEMPADTPAVRFLKELADFCIFTPDTAVLRGWIKDTQDRDPVGLSGGGLARALSEIVSDSGVWSILEDELKEAISWFEELFVDFGPDEKDRNGANVAYGFVDKFFQQPRMGFPLALSPNEVNEGALYLLFVAILCLHPNAPGMLALENADHSLNPLLVRHLMSTICKWLLPSCRNPLPGVKQIDVQIDLDLGDPKFSVTIDRVYGAAIGFAKKDFLAQVCDNKQEHLFHLGVVNAPDGRELSSYATFRFKDERVYVRGGPRSIGRRCDKCGTFLYASVGAQYVLEQDLRGRIVVETDYCTLLVEEKIGLRAKSSGWPKLKAYKMPVVNNVSDSFPLNLKSQP